MANETRRLAANAVWGLVGFAIPTVVTVASISIYIHFLGLSSYGLYAIGNSVLALAGLLNLGMGVATTKYVAEFNEKKDSTAIVSVVLATVATYGLTSVLGSVTMYLAAGPLAGAMFGASTDDAKVATSVLRVIAVGFIPTVVTSVATGLLEGFQRYRVSQSLMVSRSVATFMAGTSVVAFGGSVINLLQASVVVVWVFCAIGLVVSLSQLPKVDARSLRLWFYFKQTVGYSFYTGMTSLGTTAVGQLDRLLVGGVLSLEAVGIYAIAQSVTSKVHVLGVSVTRILMPFFSARDANEQSRTSPQFVRSWRASILLTLGLAAVGVATAPWLLSLWVGPSLSSASLAAYEIFLLMYAGLSIHAVPYFYLLGLGKARAVAVPTLVGGALMTAGVAVGATFGGVTGAAVGSLIYPLVSVAISFQAVSLIGEPGLGRRIFRETTLPLVNHALAAVVALLLGCQVERMTDNTLMAFLASAATCAAMIALGYIAGCRLRNSHYVTVQQLLSGLRKKSAASKSTVAGS